MPDLASLIRAVQSPPVSAGVRVLDLRCGQTHTLARPRGAASDVLLVYECTTGSASDSANVHTGALLGRLVHGLELVGTAATEPDTPSDGARVKGTA
jgi:hypothetical protein